MAVPELPKIYHICHVDRLPSTMADVNLWCDAEITHRSLLGTTIPHYGDIGFTGIT